jgi:hypothetical protein
VQILYWELCSLMTASLCVTNNSVQSQCDIACRFTSTFVKKKEKKRKRKEFVFEDSYHSQSLGDITAVGVMYL